MEEERLTLSLPKIPKDAYYEDYVAALLSAGRYYLDRSIHWTEDKLDLLELDIVATKFTNKVDTTILEIKSAGWGVKDVFKLNGWLTFLGKEKAAFIYQSDDHSNIASMESAADKLHIKLICNKKIAEDKLDDDKIKEYFKISTDDVPEPVIRAFRYSYNLERVMRGYLAEFVKDKPKIVSAARTQEYFRKLNDISYFINNPVSRLHYLCDLSQKYNRIAAILDNEIADKGLLKAEDNPYFVNYYDLFFPKTLNVNPVDVASYVTLMNRIAVIKGMTEFLLLPEAEYKNDIQRFMAKLNESTLNS